ncbi:MAG TPA: hypothetical protein VF884_12830 [Nitrososphaeraceae archaeon]
MNRTTTNAIAVMFILLGAGSGLVFTSAYSQSMANSSATGNQTASGNISRGAVGSASQLNKVLGNNTEVIANNTPIGNPNASTAEKMATESNATTGTAQQQGGGNQSNQTGSQQGGGNQSNQTGNQTNPISKALQGIGKAIGIK